MKQIRNFELTVFWLFATAIAISPLPIHSSSSVVTIEQLTEDSFLPFNAEAAELGRLLFYDPILSGNRNISCGTCHHHNLSGTDGLSLGIGQGGVGVGPERIALQATSRIKRRMPRNAPTLFNLGFKDINVLMHDGRISVDNVFGNGFNTPAEERLPDGLNSILAAQSLFPLVGEVEMAGFREQNEVSMAFRQRIDLGWPLLLARIREFPEYERRFKLAFADVNSSQDIEIKHFANAIGDFVSSEWRSFDSPFDNYISGDDSALSAQQKKGMKLFFGEAGCASCHSGPLFADQSFYALAIPPFGPGRTRQFDLLNRDVGRMGESDDLADAYRFRTPTLRNVALTPPYGHNGAYADLTSIIKHHLNPLSSLNTWDRAQTVLPVVPGIDESDFLIWDDRFEMARFREAVDIEPVHLTEEEISTLVDFLHSLTGKASVKGRLGRPTSVPSGLHVD